MDLSGLTFGADYKSEAGKKELQDDAFSADYVVAKRVDKPGAYIATINSMVIKKLSSGTTYLNFDMTTDEDGGCDFDLLLTGRNGKSTYKDKRNGKIKSLPDVAKLRAGFMPCSNLDKLTPVEMTINNKPTVVYKGAEGKKIGILLNTKLVNGKNNKIYTNYECKGFFDPETNLTGSEIINNITEPKRKEEVMSGLMVIDETIQNQGFADSGTEDPFNDKPADPFADNPDKPTETVKSVEPVADMPNAETTTTEVNTETKPETKNETDSEFWENN